MDTNAARAFTYSVADAMDKATDNNTKMLAPGEFARADFLHWAWQIKFIAAKNVAHTVDKMLHACGGSGYKRDMELERYLRDGKAGWVMGPTNEVLRQFVGKAVLLGFDSLDYWNQTYNRRAVENEVKKLDADGKRELAEQAHGRGVRDGGEGARAEGVMAVVVARSLLPEDPFLETYLVRPGGATVVSLGAGRATDSRRQARRPGRGAHGARRPKARTTPARSASARTRRRRCSATSSATGTGSCASSRVRGSIRRRRAPSGCSSDMVSARRLAVVPGGASGDGRRRGPGGPDRRRRAAAVRPPRRDPPDDAARATASSSFRRHSQSRGSTSASTRRPRSPTRCARASSSR